MHSATFVQVDKKESKNENDSFCYLKIHAFWFYVISPIEGILNHIEKFGELFQVTTL